MGHCYIKVKISHLQSSSDPPQRRFVLQLTHTTFISSHKKVQINLTICPLPVLQPNLHSHTLPRTNSSSSLPGESLVWSHDKVK